MTVFSTWTRRTRSSRWKRRAFRRRQHVSPARPAIRKAQVSTSNFVSLRAAERASSRLLAAKRGLPEPLVDAGRLNSPNGRGRRRTTTIYAPTVLSIQDNRDAFLGLIYEYHWRRFGRSRDNSSPRQALTIDLRHVERMDLEAALVLTAEYHRSIQLRPGYRPLIDDKEWSPTIRAQLEMLGFYSLVGASGRTGEVALGESDQKFLEFTSGALVDPDVAADLIDRLHAVAGRTPAKEDVFPVLVEAIGNAKQHAYPPDRAADIVPNVGKWWVTAAYDQARQQFLFVVYDQGVGIPGTLPKKRFWEAIQELCPAEYSDADVIAGAIQYGRTSTNLAGRGNGLWHICNIVTELPGSSVLILSGKGEVVYNSDGTNQRTRFRNPFCGTLVKWTLQLPPEMSPVECVR